MSYSFNIKAATKEEAKQAVIDLLGNDDTKDVSVSCNGWVQWRSTIAGSVDPLTGVSIGCTASHVDRQIAA